MHCVNGRGWIWGGGGEAFPHTKYVCPKPEKALGHCSLVTSNLSNMDTIGTKMIVLVSEVSVGEE